MRIAFFSTQSYDRTYFSRFNNGHELVFFDAPLNEQTVNLAAGFGTVCAFVNDVLNTSVIAQLANNGVQLIAMRCAGYNNVDLQAAALHKIPVVRVPAYSPFAVAEHAVAMILTLNRKTHKAYNRVREGNFSLERLTGFDLHGKIVGVIGTGKIGHVFTDIMLGFGCRILTFDVVANRDLEAKGVEYLPLVKLLPQCDIISLHCPLNDQTKHIINAQTLGMMKKGVMLINTSRGALINASDVITALKSGKVGYLGIDVYEQEEGVFYENLSEEIIQDDVLLRLLTFPNVLVTSHQAFFTATALRNISETTMRNIAEHFTGVESPNQVLLRGEA